jgi:transcriptional regulator with XRE-family HTH domain
MARTKRPAAKPPRTTRAQNRKPGALPYQDPHALSGAAENRLEVAIGREVRAFRKQLEMTVTELAKAAGLSAGMLSKIENGITSPSLATLQALSTALHVPVTAFFRKFEETREATFVKSGTGLVIERRGTRAGHQYQLLGHSTGRRLTVEPYMITLTEVSDVFPLFQHAGVEFLFMLEGKVGYRHGDKTYRLEPGDSLFFDSDAPHGPDQLIELPARYLSIICYLREGEEEG